MNTKAIFPKDFSEKEKKQFDKVIEKLTQTGFKPQTAGAYKAGEQNGYSYYNVCVPGLVLLVQSDNRTNNVVHIMNALTNNILKSFI